MKMPEPQRNDLANLAGLAVQIAEISPGEDGLRRRDVSFLLRILYGHQHKRISLYRWGWRLLLSEYFASRTLGEKRGVFDLQEDAKAERKKTAKGARV